MTDKEMHEWLVNAIMEHAIQIKLDINKRLTTYYIMTEQNYKTLQEIKKLIAELEELDSTTDNQTNNQEL